MWISKNTYNRYIQAMEKANARITSLNEENRRLKKEIDDMKIERIKLNSRYMKAVDMLSGLIRWLSTKPNPNIDFPNSEKGGYEGSDIFLM